MRKNTLLLSLLLTACTSSPSLKSDLLDSTALAPPASSLKVEGKDLKLGKVRYSKDRFSERETIAWHFTSDGHFYRGVPREDREEYDSIKARIFEVGTVEEGKYRGYALERWDVIEERLLANGSLQTKNYHYYFLRLNRDLIHLPLLSKGTTAALTWNKNREVNAYVQDKWNVALLSDPRFSLPELLPTKRFTVPGQGTFHAQVVGENAAAVESRAGDFRLLAALPQGREIFRVPGDWIVCVYADGLAVPLKKE